MRFISRGIERREKNQVNRRKEDDAQQDCLSCSVKFGTHQQYQTNNILKTIKVKGPKTRHVPTKKAVLKLIAVKNFTYMKVVDSAEGIKKYYSDESVAKQYDWERMRSPRKKTFRRIELHWATEFIPKKAKILEIGAGTGFITEKLCKFGEVTGVDSSKEMLAHAKKRLAGKKAVFINADLFKLDLGKKFDCIVSFRVMLHFGRPELEKALAKMSEHLKSGGIAVFDLESRSALKRIVMAARRISGKKKEVRNPQYSRGEILEIVEKSRGLWAWQIIAADHLALFAPFFALNQLIGSDKISGWLCKADIKLKSVGFGNTRWVVVCKKK
jgi:SAM-dependent methyltransferase